MKYLGLAYFSPEKFAAMPPDEIKELVSQCPALDEKMRATGKVLISVLPFVVSEPHSKDLP